MANQQKKSANKKRPAGTFAPDVELKRVEPERVENMRVQTQKFRDDADSNKMLRFGMVFVVGVVVVFALYLVITGKMGEFVSAISKADPVWLLLGVGCFATFFLLDMLCYRLSALLTGIRLGFLDLASVAASGIVFGYLTPGQVGAAPAQIVRLTQVGLKVGDATAVQLTRFFIYQAGITVFGAVVLVARFEYFRSLFGQLVLVTFLSFAGHLVVMGALVAVIFFPDLVRKVCHFAVRLASEKLHIIKDAEAAHARVDAEVDEYDGSVHAAVRHGKVVGGAVVITLLQLVFFYCIPFCVLKALGVEDADPLNALCSAAFVQLIATAVPLPGGTGGAEGGFALFFGPELGALTAAGVVLWRLISYYLPILLCLPFVGTRSEMTPRERLETYGEAKVGVEGIKDDLKYAKRRTLKIYDAAGRKVNRVRLKTGDKVYVSIRQTTPSQNAGGNAIVRASAAKPDARKKRGGRRVQKSGRITLEQAVSILEAQESSVIEMSEEDTFDARRFD